MTTVSQPGPVVYIDGKYMAPDQAMISVYDHGFLYGDGIFEGIRVYGGKIFKLASHLERLFGGAAEIRLQPALDRAHMAQAVREVVARSGLQDGYIRLIASRGKGSLGLNPKHCPTSSTIIIMDRIHLYPQEMYEQGMPIIVAKRPRIPTECLDPAIKSLNYLNNILAKLEAIDVGMHEAIMLNLDGHVSECTGDNIFIIKNGVIHTPPVDAGILRGITRRFVIDTLAPAARLKVVQDPLALSDVLTADEVFLTGTAAEIIGVSKIDSTVIGGGRVGPITQKLAADFKSRVQVNAPED